MCNLLQLRLFHANKKKNTFIRRILNLSQLICERGGLAHCIRCLSVNFLHEIWDEIKKKVKWNWYLNWIVIVKAYQLIYSLACVCVLRVLYTLLIFMKIVFKIIDRYLRDHWYTLTIHNKLKQNYFLAAKDERLWQIETNTQRTLTNIWIGFWNVFSMTCFKLRSIKSVAMFFVIYLVQIL